MFRQNKTIRSILFLLAIFAIGFSLPLRAVFAASACTCTLTNKDCKTIFVDSKSDSIKGCKKLCSTDLGKSFQSASYATDTDAEPTTLKCAQAHDAFVTEAKKASGSSPASTTAKPTTASITPKLNVEIPGLTFSPAVITGGTVETNYLGEYINAIYKYLIGIAVTIAIVMVMVGGLQYVLASGGGSVEAGKKRIIHAVTGIVLLLSTYLILNTINPQLTTLKMIELQNVPEQPMPEIDEGDVAEEGTGGSGPVPSAKRLCHSIDECKKICPPNTPTNLPPATLPVLSDSLGFKNSGKATGTSELSLALKKAGEIAAMNGNYSIRIIGSSSGYRPVKKQIDKACNDIANNNGKSLKEGVLAWPGGSNHGSGVAVDVQLYENGKNILTIGMSESKKPQYESPAKTLSKIMDQAGFVRYGKEIWHFELKGKAASFCRCSYPNCPFPGKC